MDDEPINRGSRNSIRAPRPTSLSSDIPSVTTRRGGPPLITELNSVPERRTLFDDDETYETRAERSQIVSSPFCEEFRDIHSEEFQITLTGISERPAPPIELSISSPEPPRVSVTGILGYGGGPASPHRPGTKRTGTSTVSQRVASEGGGGSDDSSSDHSHCQKEDPQVEVGDLSEEEEEVILLIMVMEMEMVMEMRVMKVVYLVIEDHQVPKDCKDPWVPKVFKDPEDFKVIEVCKDPLVDRVYKVCVVYPEKEDHEVLEVPKVKHLLFW